MKREPPTPSDGRSGGERARSPVRQPPLAVVHYTYEWLRQTETWLHTQVSALPPEIRSRVVCETTRNLDQFGVPDLCSLYETSRWRYYREKGFRKLGVRRELPFLVEQAVQHRARLLHSHYGNVGWAALGAVERANLRHVVTFYGFDVNYLPKQSRRWLARYRTLFENVDRVLCEGPHMARCVVDLGCPADKVRVHHLGIWLDRIPFRPRVWDGKEPLRVLIAASFREKKGIPYALEALARLWDVVPLQVTVIGDADGEARSQAEKRKILAAIDAHGLGRVVRLLGYQPYSVLFEEAYKHHIFLSPSVTASDGDTEGGAPVSILEMAATGMPVVATRHCDIPEIIRHGVTGLLAEERDADGLARQTAWLLDRPDHWVEMASAARRHLEREFDARVQGRRLAEIYREVVGLDRFAVSSGTSAGRAQ